MSTDLKSPYFIHGVDNVDTPALIIYLERVNHNIALAIEMVGEVSRLRPHIKTHKSKQATELMLQAGITKFKCATIAEAELLGRSGAPDVLLAYQPSGPKIGRLISLIQTYRRSRFSCLVDSIEGAHAISESAAAHHVIIDLFIDVNVGMNRTGISPQNVLKLYAACKNLSGIKIIGLHGYDGHINDADIAIRKERADEVFAYLINVQKELASAGLHQSTIILGGSPTFPLHAARSGVECSPGTFIYWDKCYSDLFPDMNFQPAALLLTRVVSVVNETTLCLDLGHKSVASENPLNRRVYFPGHPDLIPVSHSEEHLVVQTPNAQEYHIGDVLYAMPYHVCPTCALYDTAFVIEKGHIKESWQMAARARMMSV